MPPGPTTASSMYATSSAVASLSTCVVSGAGAGSPPTEETMRGSMRRPSLAIAWYTDAICSVVTETPWPIGTLAARLSVHSPDSSRMPALSPGSSMPVVRPRPNARRYSSIRASPTSRASMIVPTLLDLARIPVTVQSIGA